jgi:CubicO group peptidase (beta-lactamase class C family)
MCVLVRGHEACALALGERRLGGGEPVGPEHAFSVASLAKAAVALVVDQLAEQGRVDVDEPVARWLPEWRAPTALHQQQVTLRHLLANASGLAPVWPLDEMLGAHVPVAEVLSRMQALRPVAAPGQHFEYLNLGFVAAATAAERAGGKPYAELLDEWIFRPLGMQASASGPRWAALPAPGRVAAHHGAWPTGARMVDDTPFANHQGAGWLAMSGADAARWMQAWLGLPVRGIGHDALTTARHPLSAASRARLKEPVVAIDTAQAGLWLAPPQAESAGYGWGWGHAHWRGLHLQQHSGASIGCTAQISLAPAAGLGIATFLSGGHLYRAALHYALIEALLEDLTGSPTRQGVQAWLELGQAHLDQADAVHQVSPQLRAEAPWSLDRISGRWSAPGCGQARIAAASDGVAELDFDDAPHWRCRLHPRGGGAFATELMEPNDGLRFMAAWPVGQFSGAAGQASRFDHPYLEPLLRQH